MELLGDPNAESCNDLACALTSPELQKRKTTVIESLKKQVLEKTELPDGFHFTFPATDAMLDELNEFVKTERKCCPFFTFMITVKGEQCFLELSGPEGAKEFIVQELGL